VGGRQQALNKLIMIDKLPVTRIQKPLTKYPIANAQ